MSIKIIPTLGVATAIGGASKHCAKGPAVLKTSEYAKLLTHVELEWDSLLEVSENYDKLNAFYKQSCVISQFTQQQFENKRPFLVVGGDHSIAVGTWAGVLNQMPPESTFALIWIDAHMDAHTLETSSSGHLHNMSVSALLGEADSQLQGCSPATSFIEGGDLYLFGTRNYDADELVLLSKMNANVFDASRIEKDGGTVKVLKKLIGTISRCYDYFAISIDLDAIDMTEITDEQTAEERGLNGADLLAVFDQLCFDKNFIGLEIAEFGPENDGRKKTEKLIYQIISSIYK